MDFAIAREDVGARERLLKTHDGRAGTCDRIGVEDHDDVAAARVGVPFTNRGGDFLQRRDG